MNRGSLRPLPTRLAVATTALAHGAGATEGTLACWAPRRIGQCDLPRIPALIRTVDIDEIARGRRAIAVRAGTPYDDDAETLAQVAA